MGIGNGLVLGLDSGELFTNCLQFAFQLFASVVGFIQFALERFQLFNAGRLGGRLQRGNKGLVKGLALEVLCSLSQIGAASPVEHVGQLLHDVQRGFWRRRLVAMHCDVAGFADELRLLPHDIGDDRTEVGVTDVGV